MSLGAIEMSVTVAESGNWKKKLDVLRKGV